MAGAKIDIDPENTKAVTRLLEAIGAEPKDVIILVCVVCFSFVIIPLYRTHVGKYEIKRKYDNLDRKRDHKFKLIEAKKERKNARKQPK